MKTRTLVCMMGLLMVMLSSGMAILIPRSRIDSSRDENKLTTTSSSSSSSSSSSISASYASCLEIPPDLPPCDFETIENYAADEAPSDPIGGNAANSDSSFDTVYRKKLWSKIGNRMDPRLRIVSENIENNLKNEAENDPEKTAIVYKLEGCLPSRLPFELPFCKDEDSSGKTVEIHRLFPFTVPSISTSKSASEDTLVFPEIDFARWLRLMSRLRDRRDSSITNDRMNFVEDSEEVASNSRHRSFYNDRSSMPTKNYVDGYSFFDLLRHIVFEKEHSSTQKKMPKTDSNSQRTEADGENEILVEFRLQDEEDLAGTYYDTTENSKSSKGKAEEDKRTNGRDEEFVENVKYPELVGEGNKISQEGEKIKIETPPPISSRIHGD